MEELLEKQIAVVYTDGSANPNPGYYGSGAHGYIYTIKNIGKKTSDKPNKYLLSTLGYLELTELAKYKELTSDEIKEILDKKDSDLTTIKNMLVNEHRYAEVIPDYYVNAYYSYSGIGTNNVAEVLAFINITNQLVNEDLNLTEIMIKTDSTYLIHIFNTVLKDDSWMNTVDTNVDYWHQIRALVNMLKDKDITIKLIKVLGHSTAIGNNLADRMAFVARNNASLNNVSSNFKLTPGKKYWNSDADRHTFLKFKQLFFTNNLRETINEKFYSIMEYKKEEDVGKKSHEALFGLVILNEAPSLIEDTIKAYQTNLNTLSIISTLDLNALYAQTTRHYHELYNNYIYNFNKRNTTLMALGEIPIVYSIVPSGLANQALDRMMLLYDIIKEYRIKDSEKVTRTFIDVTDKFYLKEPKNKVTTLLPKDTANFSLTVTVNDIELFVPIELGKDCPSRNQFKQIEKDDVSVHLVIKQASEFAYNYYILVEMKATNDIGVFCNFYGNLLLLDKKKK